MEYFSSPGVFIQIHRVFDCGFGAAVGSAGPPGDEDAAQHRAADSG